MYGTDIATVERLARAICDTRGYGCVCLREGRSATAMAQKPEPAEACVQAVKEAVAAIEALGTKPGTVPSVQDNGDPLYLSQIKHMAKHFK